MSMKRENAVPAAAIIIVISHRPMYAAAMIERKAALFRLYPTPQQASQMAQIGLNRAILDQGWRGLRIMLAYKLADRDARLLEVAAAYTSHTCAACGVIDARSRRDQSHFICIACGHEANADTNAAINILRRADGALQPVEEHRSKRPDEAGTIRRAA